MRILVVGAGAIGGYYGGRLLDAKQDVTFLVRPRRAAQLAASGLQISSPMGDAQIAAPPTVLAEELKDPYDLVLLSCKAYDLEGAIASFAPAVGEKTMILPLLNGMRHLDVLDQRFGAGKVLGGLAVISTVLEPDGGIAHLNQFHSISFGERDGSLSARAQTVATAFATANFVSHLSPAIVLNMWEKWVFIASCAAITCLMRSNVGDIVAAGGAPLATQLVDECAAIAASQGFAPRESSIEQSKTMLTTADSTMAASMFRDIERGGMTEGEHMLGDLLRRGQEKGLSSPMLNVATVHLRAYEARRKREAAALG